MLKEKLRAREEPGGEIAWRWRVVNENVAWLLKVPSGEVLEALEPEALEAMLSFDIRMRQARQT